MGNLYSVVKVLEYVNVDVCVVVSVDFEIIFFVDWVVFLGVGVIWDCVGEICCLGLDQVVQEVVKIKLLLGICVGM